jgi:prephenate dehydratase
MAMCRKCALFGTSTVRLSAAWNRLPNKSSRCVSQSFSSKPGRLKLLSTRARAELWRLQAAMRHAAEERNNVTRILLTSRSALTPDAQRELWLEFSWADQEYRHAVAQLAAFCEKHEAKTAPRTT